MSSRNAAPGPAHVLLLVIVVGISIYLAVRLAGP